MLRELIGGGRDDRSVTHWLREYAIESVKDEVSMKN